MIEYIMINNSWKKKVKDTRMGKSLELNADYQYLVLAKNKIEINRHVHKNIKEKQIRRTNKKDKNI